MNQQRARRFRAAQEAKEKDEQQKEFQTLLRRQQASRGEDATSTEEVVKKTWDSNVITPGTPFMWILAKSVRYWCQWKLNTDPAWADIKVIISDASVPGEGEHKIMQFIRSQRSDPEYDPNTRHVMYGLDADLIMLGLATHEPHFRIIREDVFFQDAKTKNNCRTCGQPGHYADQCRGVAKVKSGEFDEKAPKPEDKPFLWLSVSVLREYLAAEMFAQGQPFRFDLERAIDDWVFMCFFVGNDFLPHLPSLDIHEDGIDKLIAIWRDNLPIMGGYLTCDGSVDLARAQCILQGLAKQEDAIFRRRREVEEKRDRNQKRRQGEQNNRGGRDNKRGRRGSPDYNRGGKADNRAPTGNTTSIVFADAPTGQIDYNMIVNRGAVDKSLAANKSAAAALKERMLAGKSAETPTKPTNGAAETSTPESAIGKRKAELIEDDAESADSGTPGRNTPLQETAAKPKFDPDNPPPDTVCLWEDGYSDRYYEQKFHVSKDDIEFRHKVARAYVEGLSWVLLYYFQGCPSWTWYYPYHYAPFAADFVDLDKMTVKFEKGKPFRPYEQLMGVFPAASNHAIPKPFRPLMEDEDSEIIDFYPEDFEIDLNGKKQIWKAIALLPFIDEKRLLTAMGTKYPELTQAEHDRNAVGYEALLVADQHPLYDTMAMEFYSKKAKDAKEVKLVTRTGRLAGHIVKNEDFLPHMDLRGPAEDIKLEPNVNDDRSMNVHFIMPPATHVHKSMLFPGVKMPEAALDKTDLAILKGKARNSGRDFGGAPLYDNTRRDPMDNQRAPRINYAADRIPMGLPPPPFPPPIPPPGVTARDNPFAAFLDPKFAGGMPGGGMPVPPPPMQFQQQRHASQGYQQGAYQQGSGGGYQGGYQNQQNGQGRNDGGYGGRQQQGNGYYGQQGHQNGDRRSASDSYQQGRGGGGAGRSYGQQGGGYGRR